MSTDYASFIASKSQLGGEHGIKTSNLPDFLFDFQKYLVEWSLRKGRSANFAQCGLGKSGMELAWADLVVKHTNKRVLLLTPLAVSSQMIREADKFGIEAERSQEGKYSGKLIVTNYERLHYFNASDFVGVVCDESSILKGLAGETRKQITRFMSKLPYRLLATATAAPNDYVELGTSSEAIGELNHSEMLRRFFRQLDDKGQKREERKQQEAEELIKHDGEYFAKLAFRVAQTIGQWRLKNHAVEHFWRWVSSWARACRKPSDLGFSDDGFVLPPLTEQDHIITPKAPPQGFLFNVPAFGMQGEREERRRTMHERCEYVANLVNHDRPALVWCHMNEEGDTLERMIKDSKQVAGRTPDDLKEELYQAFIDKQLRVLICKPKIGAWGLNLQHCNHVVTFASHSFEQHYQSVRRCWRFGQKLPVQVDVVATEGEVRVLANMRRKAGKADHMFEMLVKEMMRAERIERMNEYQKPVELPTWLRKTV